jgi:integrase
MAYAGLRPGEVCALRWDDVQESTLLVQRATNPDGSLKSTKATRHRSVGLLPLLAQELREYRLAVGRPRRDAFLVAGGSNGSPWDKWAWQRWRADRWGPACRRAQLDTVPRPYDLRHSFASLLLAEGSAAFVGRKAAWSFARGAALDIRTPDRRVRGPAAD